MMQAGDPGGLRRRHRLARVTGTGLLVAGLAVLAWTLVVWQWNDPFTSLYTRWQQHQLAAEHRQLVAIYRPKPLPPKVRSVPLDQARYVRHDAARFRARVSHGEPIGRIVVPRLDLKMLLVNGTSHDDLTKGPGRDERTYMPGQGQLVYIAGHRTTYGAPFAHIDRLQPGDRITLEMPYGTFRYAVTGHEIVDDNDLSVLRSRGNEVVALQACHPRFFATQRYIVWAKSVLVTLTDGSSYKPLVS
jgi:sortase A